jgi:hypothetical protein
MENNVNAIRDYSCTIITDSFIPTKRVTVGFHA